MNDLFISYAHIDDLPISEDQKGWITEFQRILENRLAQLMGVKPKIWRDQKLSGSDIFDEQIVEQFKNTKLMVSILSPRPTAKNISSTFAGLVVGFSWARVRWP